MKISTEDLLGYQEQDAEFPAHLLELPHKILLHHDVNGLTQIVLHELGHNDSFGLSKASYLIDNPDFNCLKGVAGFCKDECRLHKNDLWDNPESFVHDMENAQFHHKISTFFDKSLVHNATSSDDAIKILGQMLGMNNPLFLTWKMKHGNHGILLFEGEGSLISRRKSLLQNFVALLSLC